eukprot:1137770-Pelagomonas_calceolata.AAC.11
MQRGSALITQLSLDAPKRAQTQAGTRHGPTLLLLPVYSTHMRVDAFAAVRSHQTEQSSHCSSFGEGSGAAAYAHFLFFCLSDRSKSNHGAHLAHTAA